MYGLFHSPTIPPSLSMCECGAAGSARGRTASPVRSTIHQSLGLAPWPQVPACLRPSYQSGLMFLLYLLGCWTSMWLDFLSVLVVFCFKIVVVLLLVVQGGAVCLPTPPS